MKPVLVTTRHRGVFAGLIPDELFDSLTSEETIARLVANQDGVVLNSMPLREARMAIRWRKLKGIMDLAHSGPNDDCLIGAPADVPLLKDITGIFAITDEAWEKWVSA